MLKAHRFDVERKVFITDFPTVRHLAADFPVSAAGVGTVINRIGFVPHRVLFFRLPNDLGVGANQRDAPPALQTLAAGAVEQFIIFPIF